MTLTELTTKLRGLLGSDGKWSQLMSEQTHSPLPWSVGAMTLNFPGDESEIIYHLVDADGRSIVAGIDKRDAEFIVQAVNSHATLIEALRRVDEICIGQTFELQNTDGCDRIGCDVFSRLIADAEKASATIREALKNAGVETK